MIQILASKHVQQMVPAQTIDALSDFIQRFQRHEHVIFMPSEKGITVMTDGGYFVQHTKVCLPCAIVFHWVDCHQGVLETTSEYYQQKYA